MLTSYPPSKGLDQVHPPMQRSRMRWLAVRFVRLDEGLLDVGDVGGIGSRMLPVSPMSASLISEYLMHDARFSSHG